MVFRFVERVSLAIVILIAAEGGSLYAGAAGVKSLGMASACVAHPVDAFAGVSNPAALTLLSDRLDLGGIWVQSYQRATLRDLPAYPDEVAELYSIQPALFNRSYDGAEGSNSFLPEVAAVKGLSFSRSLGQLQIAAAFAFYNHSGLKSRYEIPFPFFGDSPMGFELLRGTAALQLALRLYRMHSFGLSANYNLQRLKINGLEKFCNSYFSLSPSHCSDRGYNYSNGGGITVGYLFEWSCWKFGASWHPKAKMKKFKKYRGFIADRGCCDLPETLRAGFSYQPISCVTFAFDYEYICWREVAQWRNSPFPNLFFSDSDSRFLFGAPRGPGFGFSNQSIYRFGVECEIDPCCTLRVGFRHENSPLEERYTLLNMLSLDCMENIVTFGGSWKINRCNEVSLFYGVGMTKKVRGNRSIPAEMPQPTPNDAPPYTGRENIPINVLVNDEGSDLTDERAGGEVDLKQRKFALGIAWGWLF